MDLEALRKNLGILTLSELEQLGLANEDGWDEEIVRVFNTSLDLDKKHSSSTWIAAIKNDDLQLVYIVNGILYDEAGQMETGKEVEVGRLLITEEKAEMLVEAIRHSFPHLLENCEADEEEENEEAEPTESPKIESPSSEPSPLVRGAKMEDQVPLRTLDSAKSIDEAIVLLRNNIYLLEKAQKEGLEIASTSNEWVTFKKGATKSPSSDDLIDAFNKCKDKVREMAEKRKAISKTDGEVLIESLPRNGGKTLFLATSPKSGMIHLLEANLDLLARQDHQLRGNVSAINLDKNSGKRIIKFITAAFSKPSAPEEVEVTPCSD